MVADQLLLVAHPAIGAVFFAKAVLRNVRALFEQLGLLGFDRREILRVDAGPPEIGIFQIFVGASTRLTFSLMKVGAKSPVALKL